MVDVSRLDVKEYLREIYLGNDGNLFQDETLREVGQLVPLFKLFATKLVYSKP